MTRRGLGRGLGALLATEVAGPGTVRTVEVGRIEPNPYQPRVDVADEAIDELAASIRAHGLIQPLVVKEVGAGRFQLIAGERRWHAAQAAGLKEVPVVVREAEPREMLALAIIENVQRSDLDPLEAARAYQRLMEEFGLTQTEVAETVGKSRSAVANTMRLLGLDENVQGLIRAGELTEGHGRALLAVEHAGQRHAMAVQSVRNGWSVRQLENAVRLAMGSGRTKAPVAGPDVESAQQAPDPDTAAAVRALERSLATRVEIRRKGDAGQLVLYFYSEEELDTLYQRLVARP